MLTRPNSSRRCDRSLDARDHLKQRLFDTRGTSLDLVSTLSAEDMVVQAMEDASPSKWHLAHVTWFFETFVASQFLSDYRTCDERLQFCFNSYYESHGPRQPRGRRGLLSRPSISEVLAYRSHVDRALARLMDMDDLPPDAARLIELGINHEQQHQELLLTDILSLFAANPLRPAYRSSRPCAGWSSQAESSASVMMGMASRGTTKGLGTRCSCGHFCSRTGWSRTVSG